MRPGRGVCTASAARCVRGASARPTATPATVGASKIARTGRSTPNSACSAAVRRVASRELPPTSKKLSSAPGIGCPSTVPNTSATRRSRSVAGAREALPDAKTGSGNAFRSSLPDGVTGTSSMTVIAAGTMYAGSRFRVTSRTAALSISPSPAT